MLILKVKIGQSLMVGDAEVAILQSTKGSVRVGVTAPRNMLITRKGVTSRIQAGECDVADIGRRVTDVKV